MPNYDDAVLGVQIDMLVAGGPAEQAGLAEGDVIIRIGERTIDSVADYMNALADLVVGQQVEVRVQRGQEQKSLQVKVGQRSQ
jgi:S1-C subfamily serine protease